MIRVETSPSLRGGLQGFFGLDKMDPSSLEVLSESKTKIVMRYDDVTLKFFGRGMILDSSADDFVGRAGTVDTVVFAVRGGDFLKVTGLGENLSVLAWVIGRELSFSSGWAVEEYFFGLDFTYAGGDRADYWTAGSDEWPYGSSMSAFGNNRAELGGGNDVFYLAGGDDFAFGGAGRDRLYGEDDGDRLFGGAGRDSLYGGDDNDILSGQSGSDRLSGGEGDDQLKGGRGEDVFDLTRTNGSNYMGRDQILDFQAGEDRIEISAEDGWVVASQVENELTLTNDMGEAVVFVGVLTGTLTIDDLI